MIRRLSNSLYFEVASPSWRPIMLGAETSWHYLYKHSKKSFWGISNSAYGLSTAEMNADLIVAPVDLAILAVFVSCHSFTYNGRGFTVRRPMVTPLQHCGFHDDPRGSAGQTLQGWSSSLTLNCPTCQRRCRDMSQADVRCGRNEARRTRRAQGGMQCNANTGLRQIPAQSQIAIPAMLSQSVSIVTGKASFRTSP